MFDSKRDPGRIYPFVNDLGAMWAIHCSEWRFGQLMENIMKYIRSNGDDPFYLEDNDFREYIEKYLQISDKT